MILNGKALRLIEDGEMNRKASVVLYCRCVVSTRPRSSKQRAASGAHFNFPPENPLGGWRVDKLSTKKKL
jgi:hypothetical protein